MMTLRSIWRGFVWVVLGMAGIGIGEMRVTTFDFFLLWIVYLFLEKVQLTASLGISIIETSKIATNLRSLLDRYKPTSHVHPVTVALK